MAESSNIHITFIVDPINLYTRTVPLLLPLSYPTGEVNSNKIMNERYI